MDNRCDKSKHYKINNEIILAVSLGRMRVEDVGATKFQRQVDKKKQRKRGNRFMGKAQHLKSKQKRGNDF